MQSDLLPLRCCRSVRSTKVPISGGTALLQDVTTLVCPFTFGHQQVTLLLLMRQKTHVLKLFLLSSERRSQMPGVDEPSAVPVGNIGWYGKKVRMFCKDIVGQMLELVIQKLFLPRGVSLWGRWVCAWSM